MPRGSSKRIVIEVEPDFKRRLYTALAGDGSTLKDWFIEAAQYYLSEREQPSLPELTTKPPNRAKKL